MAVHIVHVHYSPKRPLKRLISTPLLDRPPVWRVHVRVDPDAVPSGIIIIIIIIIQGLEERSTSHADLNTPDKLMEFY